MSGMTGFLSTQPRLMSAGKRLLRSPPVQALLVRAGALYIRLVCRTTRWTTLGGEVPAAFWDRGRPFIGCFWHGRLIAMPHSWRPGAPIRVLTSGHADGRLLAAIVGRLGFPAVAGSTRKGGAKALRAMRKLLAEGTSVGITPDGPRGPRMRVSPGAVQLAAITGAPLVPASFATSRRRVLGTWDRFVLALPFARGVFVFGEPVTVPRDADAARLEACRQALEARLNEITARADRLCGQPQIDPAEAPPAPAAAAAPMAAPMGLRARAGGR